MKFRNLLLSFLGCGMGVVMSMTVTPIISRSKTVYTSSGTAAYLVDNSFVGTAFNVANNTWIALNVGTGKTSVYFDWNNPNYTWSDQVAAAGSCKQTPAMPVNYTIQKSSNSTNGSDGTWTTMVTVTNNNVTARGHVVDFTGASWIKMSITSGGGQINEVEVFDLSSGGNDLWFFPGTSISANTYKGTPPAQNYADLIKQSYPTFTPMMIRGGIPCINSTQFKNDINLYLAAAGNVKYWAIEMGTNDAWGGTNGGVSTFKTNMQAVITACKNAGIQPIIARLLSTNASAAGWQVHADYLKAIDDLTTQNNLTAGPDLYTYFLSHASELNSDGVHPNATGAASIQRLWAEKMGPALYASSNPTPTISLTAPANNSTSCVGSSITISATASVSSGSISKVDFYDGNTLLNSDNASPYSYIWSNPVAGAHTIRAIATSAANVVSAEATLTVTVNAATPIDPYLQIDGGTWGPQTSAQVCEGASLNIGPHPVDANGWTWTGPDNFTASTREIQFPSIALTQGGEYTANYKDANGCTSTAKIPVTVNAKPVVMITAPTNGATVSGNPPIVAIAVNVTGTGINNVQFYNGTTLLGTDATSPYSYTWSDVASGTYTINVKATNTNNCVGTASATVTVTQVTSISDDLEANGISCYPNPFTGEFTIQSKEQISGYSIMDLSGKVLESGTGLKAGASLQPGIYLLKIRRASEDLLLKIVKE